MKKNPVFAFQVVLVIVDLLVIIIAFSLAYYYRIHFDPRPFYFESNTIDFIISVAWLTPIWFIVFILCGLYNPSIYILRSKVYGRLLVVAAIGTMSMVSYEFFAEVDIFPVRVVAIYAFALSFVLLVLAREVLMLIRRRILKSGRGLLNVLIIGNTDGTYMVANDLNENPESGYRVCGIIANNKYIPVYMRDKKCKSLELAIKETKPDVVLQTDNDNNVQVYNEITNHHLSYMFVPNQELVISHSGEMDVIGFQPVIHVKVTPLVGSMRLVKRLGDIIFGSIFLVLISPLMLIIAIIIKLSDGGSPIYKTTRLTRYVKKAKIYKFRSMNKEYSGMSPEKAFTKMGKPELIKIYRDNGDQLDDDPRITGFGKFIRSASLDELPQLINVVRGDISLVGPRALAHGELDKTPNKNLILSVKSGLTGLAQVSGRREISFEERRLLDVYYIQNWSILLDIQIVLKTVTTIVLRRGAK